MPMSLIDDNGHYIPAPYVLTMSCVSGDELQVAIHRREDIFRWLKTLDHEGSSWSVVEMARFGAAVEFISPEDITEDIMREYGER